MAKIYGLQGAMTGKLANTVMVVRNGVQIARKYQPVVSNPSTSLQVAARARLKLMSQLSAVLGPNIAIPRVGGASPRNMFTKLNYGSSTYSPVTHEADIALSAIQITKSVIPAPSVPIARRGTNNIEVAVDGSSLPEGTTHVVYVMCRKFGNSLENVASRVIDAPGAGYNWMATFNDTTDACVFYVYAVRGNTEHARAAFGNLQVISSETVAKLIAERMVTEADVTLTKTAYTAIEAQV